MALPAIALRLLLWLVRRYGVRIAGAILVWIGIELGEDLIEGAAKEIGADAVKQLKQANEEAKQTAAAGRSPVSHVENSVLGEVLRQLREHTHEQERETNEWDNPLDEPANLARQELCDWEKFENADPCA